MLTRRRRPVGDTGATLAELVVCMALTTIVGAMALSFFLWTGSATNATTASSYTLQTSRVAMSTVTGILRLAVADTVTPTTVNPGSKLSSSVTFNAMDSAVAGCASRPSAVVTLIIANAGVRMDRSGPVNAPVSGNPCRYLANQASSRVLISGVRVGSTGFRTTDSTTAAAPTTVPANIAAVTFVMAVNGQNGDIQTFTSTAVISGGDS